MNSTAESTKMLLQHHLKALRLPVFLREYAKTADQCSRDGSDYGEYLFRLSERELLERESKATLRRIKAARFPVLKHLEDFDFSAVPSLNKKAILDLKRCEWITKSENAIFMGNPGVGKSHLATALGLAACQAGHTVRFCTAAGLVNALIEARDEKTLLRLQRTLAKAKLLIIDELGYVPFSKTGAELLFEIFCQRYENGSVLVTSNLPFEEWTSIFDCQRLTGALLDRLTHRAHILPIQGDSYRLAQSKLHRFLDTQRKEENS